MATSPRSSAKRMDKRSWLEGVEVEPIQETRKVTADSTPSSPLASPVRPDFQVESDSLPAFEANLFLDLGPSPSPDLISPPLKQQRLAVDTSSPSSRNAAQVLARNSPRAVSSATSIAAPPPSPATSGFVTSITAPTPSPVTSGFVAIPTPVTSDFVPATVTVTMPASPTTSGSNLSGLQLYAQTFRSDSPLLPFSATGLACLIIIILALVIAFLKNLAHRPYFADKVDPHEYDPGSHKAAVIEMNNVEGQGEDKQGEMSSETAVENSSHKGNGGVGSNSHGDEEEEEDEEAEDEGEDHQEDSPAAKDLKAISILNRKGLSDPRTPPRISWKPDPRSGPVSSIYTGRGVGQSSMMTTMLGSDLHEVGTDASSSLYGSRSNSPANFPPPQRTLSPESYAYSSNAHRAPRSSSHTTSTARPLTASTIIPTPSSFDYDYTIADEVQSPVGELSERELHRLTLPQPMYSDEHSLESGEMEESEHGTDEERSNSRAGGGGTGGLNFDSQFTSTPAPQPDWMQEKHTGTSFIGALPIQASSNWVPGGGGGGTGFGGFSMAVPREEDLRSAGSEGGSRSHTPLGGKVEYVQPQQAFGWRADI